MTTVGIVLAAGASQRMGRPKALLRDAAGVPLAVRQAEALRTGGCDSVAVVIGSQAQQLRAELPAGLALVENPRWAQGRVTSLQAAMTAFPEAEGYLFLPVDAAGVTAAAIGRLLTAATGCPDAVWRPVFRGGKGNLLWVPRIMARELMRLAPGARVDEWARPFAREVEVDDPAVLRNINTPEDWARLTGVLVDE